MGTNGLLQPIIFQEGIKINNIRTDNCVKNHLYSKLRKSLRTLNKIVRTSFKKQLKEISTTVLYKLTEATE